MTDHLPQVTTLLSSRKKIAGITLISMIFAALGILFVMSSHDAWLGWFCIVFFSLFFLFCLFQLISPNKLILTSEGFEQCILNRNTNIKWHEVSEFIVTEIGHSKNVSYSFLGAEGKLMSTIAEKMNGGQNGTLIDTFGLKAEELGGLMNQYRYQALKR